MSSQKEAKDVSTEIIVDGANRTNNKIDDTDNDFVHQVKDDLGRVLPTRAQINKPKSQSSDLHSCAGDQTEADTRMTKEVGFTTAVATVKSGSLPTKLGWEDTFGNSMSAKFSITCVVDKDTDNSENNSNSSKSRFSTIPGVHRVAWADFKNIYVDREIYAVDVLTGNPKFYWQRRKEELERKRQSKNTNEFNTHVEEDTANNHIRAQQEMCERIRVNSEPVLTILRDIASEDWEVEPVVFLRPYKFFSYYESEIRKSLLALEKTWGESNDNSHAQTDAEKKDMISGNKMTHAKETGQETLEKDMKAGIDVDAGLARPPDNELESKAREIVDTLKAYKDLKCLVEFLDSDIYPTIKQHGSNSCQKVYFRDLWHLFKPGVEVFSSVDGNNANCWKFPGPSQPQNLVEREIYSYQKVSERQIAWRVLSVSQGRPILRAASWDERDRPPSKRVRPFKIVCYCIDFDGDGFGPVSNSFEFQPFDGEKDITSLDVFPFKFVKNYEKKRNDLREQGLKFMQFTKPTHQLYTGPTLTYHPSGDQCYPAERSENIDGHVIVDFKEAARSDSRWLLNLFLPDVPEQDELESTESYPLSIWKGNLTQPLEEIEFVYDDNDVDDILRKEHIATDKFLTNFENRLSDDQMDGSEFEDSELILLPNRVCAFILQRRSFALLRLDKLRPVQAQAQSWTDLKLPQGHKKMVQAQVKTHFQDKKARIAASEDWKDGYDLVRGKGQGLIILLHGVPGVGKTSTAECVAEYLGKPLFPITCGDLGTTAQDVETKLNETFAMAQAWDCVLLLDEADVFLAQRSKSDLKRNAIVSGKYHCKPNGMSAKLFNSVPTCTRVLYWYFVSNCCNK